MAKKKETKTKRPSVVYRDIATGKIYTTMPKGYIRYSDLDAKGKRAADEIQNEAFPYNALSNYGSEGVVVYPNRQTLEDADTSWHLADPTETDKNMFHRANVAAEDKRVARSSNFEAALNFASPTTYIGALFDAAQGKKSFMDSMLDGNSGIVTDKFQQEHPYLSMGANFLGDLVTGALVDKALKGAVSLSRVKPINLESDILENAPKVVNNGSKLKYISFLKNNIDNLIGKGEIEPNKILGKKRVRRINAFMEKDVAPRLRQRLNEEGVTITDDMEDVINMKAPNISIVSDDDFVAASPFGEPITFSKSVIGTYDKNTLEKVMVHEMEHKQRELLNDIINKNESRTANLGNGRIIKDKGDTHYKRLAINNGQKGSQDHIINYTTYSPTENSTLNEAYTFTDRLADNISYPTLEKGATNRTFRYNIARQAKKELGRNIYGKELDAYIDTLDENTILNNLLKEPDDYFNNLYINAVLGTNSVDKIKHSLKYVPAIISTLMGGAAIGNNIRNEQMR